MTPEENRRLAKEARDRFFPFGEKVFSKALDIRNNLQSNEVVIIAKAMRELESLIFSKQELDKALDLISKMRGQWIHSVHKDDCLSFLEKHNHE